MATLKKITYLCMVALLFMQCAKENKYLIEKGKVGYLTKTTTILELHSIFEKDSIVSNIVLPLNTSESKEKLFLVGNDAYR